MKWSHPVVWVVLWVAAYAAARFALELETLAFGVRLGAALLPVPIGVTMLALVVRAAGQLDELQRRIQVEALATAFLLVMILLMTLGLLQRVVTLKFEDWSYMHVWGMMPMLYLLGWALAQRRYQ